jgi:hypothetical protein
VALVICGAQRVQTACNAVSRDPHSQQHCQQCNEFDVLQQAQHGLGDLRRTKECNQLATRSAISTCSLSFSYVYQVHFSRPGVALVTCNAGEIGERHDAKEEDQRINVLGWGRV